MSEAQLGRNERLICVVGPSGAGKGTVLRHWLATLPRPSPVQVAQRAITRPALTDAAAKQHEPVGVNMP